MNIFILDRDTQLCARYHLDKHVVKMPLESAQLLCTAVLAHGGTSEYKPAHKNHPCAIWARETQENFLWLVDLGIELCHEYRLRYGKIHKCLKVINNCFRVAKLIPSGGLTPFAQAMPDKYKAKDPVVAYRAYYLGDKKSMASWKDREEPEWWVNVESQQDSQVV
jgi:hypothetical protein